MRLLGLLLKTHSSWTQSKIDPHQHLVIFRETTNWTMSGKTPGMREQNLITFRARFSVLRKLIIEKEVKISCKI